MRAPLPTAVLIVILTALYFAAGKVGLYFATLNSSASAVWPPTGIALGAFLLFGHRVWPAILLGAFLVNVTTTGAILASLAIAGGNTLEGIAGAWLVNRFANGRSCFERARDVFRFAGLAALLATTISATVGVTTITLSGLAQWHQFGSVWLTWWLGDAAGALIITPLFLLWAPGSGSSLPPERLTESTLMLGAVVAVGAAFFTAPGLRDYPLAFLCLPPLAWIALRFGPREVATAIFVLTAIAVAATENGLGSFVMRSRNDSLLVLQAFMGMLSVTLLPMAALVREHRQAVTEAEAATRSRDVFLAMLSHELRNPLQAISTSLQLLSLPNVKAEDSERAVAIARRQTDHLTRLLSDLLDVTRAVSGKIQLDLRRVRLDEAVQRYVELLKSLGRLDGRKVTVDAHAVAISGDAVRLEQILGNLISNAVKFTEPGGEIRVIVLEEGGEAVLRVQDDGVGIAPDLLPRVFDLFTQGKRKFERGQAGLGVGLTLVRTLSELHGARAQAHSAGLGEGAEFIVRFPLVDEPSGPAMRRHVPTTASSTGTRRILVIEDNADARDTLQALLELDGHDVYAAADGETGLAKAEEVRPDVVLVDIGLPGIDGYEVARRLRAMCATYGVDWRLIALTGHGQPEDVSRAHDAGFDSHLTKPVMPQELAVAMA